MKRILIGVFVLAALCLPMSAFAAAIGGGWTSGPNSSFSINFTFENVVGSTSDIVGIQINGATAGGGTIIWDSVGSVTDPAGASSIIGGVDTALLNISFTDNPDGFNPGEQFSLSGIDPDWEGAPSSGITIGDIIGVQVLFLFEDASQLLYAFVDDPEEGAGLVLEAVNPSAVPIPAAVWLLGSGLLGLAGLRRKLSS